LLEGMWGCKGGAEEVREEGRAGEGWLLRPARGLVRGLEGWVGWWVRAGG